MFRLTREFPCLSFLLCLYFYSFISLTPYLQCLPVSKADKIKFTCIFMNILLNAHRSLRESVIAVPMHWFWLHAWLQWRYLSWPLPSWHRLVCFYSSFLPFHRCTFHLRFINTLALSLASLAQRTDDCFNGHAKLFHLSVMNNWPNRIYMLINCTKCANLTTHCANCTDCVLTTDFLMCCVHGVWMVCFGVRSNCARTHSILRVRTFAFQCCIFV